MLLYRAQTKSTGMRLRAPAGNEPSNRVKGRWFTDCIEMAYHHLETLSGPTEIVCLELDDAIAATFKVSETPYTACGLAPIEHALAPDSDYVLPRFFAAQAEKVESIAEDDAGEIHQVDFTFRGRVEIGRVTTADGDVVLYDETGPVRTVGMVCEQTGQSISFDAVGAVQMGALLYSSADRTHDRRAA